MLLEVLGYMDTLSLQTGVAEGGVMIKIREYYYSYSTRILDLRRESGQSKYPVSLSRAFVALLPVYSVVM